MKEKYFYAIDSMSIDELEIWRLLYRYSNYETNIAGYTINQLVTGADKRLNLTTQKVRTILKNFEKQGYIKFLSSGSKGRESKLLITIREQLFDNAENKNEEVETNNPTTNKKKKNSSKKSEYDLIIGTYTENSNLYETIKDFTNMRKTIKKPLTDRALKTLLSKLDSLTSDDNEKIEILETSINNCWLSVYELKNKKAPVGTGAKNKNNFNKNVCKGQGNNTEKIKFINNF